MKTPIISESRRSLRSAFGPLPGLGLLLLALACALTQVRAGTTHYVNLNNAAPASPYLTWASAATNIQAAVDAASAGDEIVVSNGVYQTGSRVVYGATANRVAVTKAVWVRSFNGPAVTVIRGYQVPGTTNGESAIRCVYLTNGAFLGGFTLSNGAVRKVGDVDKERSGGGVWCESTSAVVSNCVLSANAANAAAGGAFRGTLKQCLLTGNWAANGGGACLSALTGSALRANHADNGGGAYSCNLTNCTLTGNSAGDGGGVCVCTVLNSIVRTNTATDEANYTSDSLLSYCCTTPLPASGTGNLDTDPMLTDGVHVAPASPCAGRGSFAAVNGLDIDGEPWPNPPVIGCDQPPILATGPITVSLQLSATNTMAGLLVTCQGTLVGQVSAFRWELGDGLVVSNLLVISHAWMATGDYAVVLRAYNQTYPAGVTATVAVHVTPEVRYVLWNNPTPSPPYASWATAATNIQGAVDAAVTSGALVLVSNGVYQTGRRVVYGAMTNRLVVDKPITIQSVNGPAVTLIQGYQTPGTTNGGSAIRCVYLTNGALLSGFTLTNGATCATGDTTLELSGGGVWCASTNEIVTNCIVTANSAAASGGGVYAGNLQNCLVTNNWARLGGGGACNGFGNNCFFVANSAPSGPGGGAYNEILHHCTLVGNAATSAGGAYLGTLRNCILYNNQATNAPNYSGGTFNYCCTTPMPGSGTGNITGDPQLTDFHLSPSSPCRGTGSASYTTGVDLDGEPWLNPPSIGCDEYRSGSVTGPLTVAIQVSSGFVALGSNLTFTAVINGRITASVWNFGDGTILSNAPLASHAWSNAGDYAVILRAYNDSYPAGVSATVTIQAGGSLVHHVALTSSNPMPPYASWSTAAQSIQDAVDAALPGALILVSNGVYSTGGRVVSGAMTNRVAVTKPVTVQSLNGPVATVIQGYQVPGSLNGDAAIRCVYLTNGAVLSGFTLSGGGTRAGGGINAEQSGGGVWCESTNALVTNCVITANGAMRQGGGVYAGTLQNCTLTGNSAQIGGGACFGIRNNCLIITNHTSFAGGLGGGAYSDALNNCTLTGNRSASAMGGPAAGSGASDSTLNNCIVYSNTTSANGNYLRCTLNYCCTMPAPTNGVGNITNSPDLADAFHLNGASPCRGAGSPAFVTGVDLDGEAWANPPSIGCDEYHAEPVTGPLTVAIGAPWTGAAPGLALSFTAQINGQTTASVWDFGDGTIVSNCATVIHAWNVAGQYTLALRAYNDTYPAGVTATLIIRVLPAVYYVSAASPAPAAPYASWNTAAHTIQDAVDAVAALGARVLVTNGVYSTGGQMASGLITNRVAVTKPVTVQSVNGPLVTVIQGWQLPGTTTGDGAVRCVYLTNGALLAGFTLSNGAVRAVGDSVSECSGGGAWCESADAVISNCVFSANAASYAGGGAWQGTLKQCVLKANHAGLGGGVYASALRACALQDNLADTGGGAHSSTLVNCTLVDNLASDAGGVYLCDVTNSILWGNSSTMDPEFSYHSHLEYCCSTRLPDEGTGNQVVDPQLTDGVHVSSFSPCYRQGSYAAVSGLDIDGQVWANPPAIGCDERPVPATGPISLSVTVSATNTTIGTLVTCQGAAVGQVSDWRWGR